MHKVSHVGIQQQGLAAAPAPSSVTVDVAGGGAGCSQQAARRAAAAALDGARWAGEPWQAALAGVEGGNICQTPCKRGEGLSTRRDR